MSLFLNCFKTDLLTVCYYTFRIFHWIITQWILLLAAISRLFKVGHCKLIFYLTFERCFRHVDRQRLDVRMCQPVNQSASKPASQSCRVRAGQGSAPHIAFLSTTALCHFWLTSLNSAWSANTARRMSVTVQVWDKEKHWFCHLHSEMWPWASKCVFSFFLPFPFEVVMAQWNPLKNTQPAPSLTALIRWIFNVTASDDCGLNNIVCDWFI